MSNRRHIWLLLLCVCALCHCQGQSMELTDIAAQVKGIISEQFNTETSYNTVRELYRNLTESSVSGMINGSELVNHIEDRIRSKLLLVESLLQESLSVLEQSYSARYQSPCCLCLSDSDVNPTACKSECNTSFPRATVDVMAGHNETDSLSGEPLEQQYSELFGRNVSFNNSALHVPVDIYDRDPSLLCFVDWTENLTTHFMSQRERAEEEDITNQYFGGTLGAVRFYPGSIEWSHLYQCQRCPLPPKDTYHASERPWYVQTILGNKFMAIVLDLSGSMSGFKLLLAQIAIVRLLKTLTPNDYFYVVGSQSVVTSPLRCFVRMTRATPANVLAVSEEIMRYSNKNLTGQVDFNVPLQLVFQQLDNSSISRCHDFIVVFTDHESEKQQLIEALDSYNRSNQVRVFTFIVGQSYGNPVLDKISCRYRGSSFKVEYYNDIHEQIINFTNKLHSLLNPMFAVDSSVFWNHYRDVYGSYVLTGSLPFVDNQTTPELVGVLGMDFNMTRFQESLKQNLMDNAYYYLFMIDNTGALVFHPQVNNQVISMSSADDPLKFDVREYEHAVNSSEFERVRWSMMSRESGDHTLEAWIPIQREHRYVLRNVTYFYKPVGGTTFSVAAVVVSDMQDFLTFNSTTVRENIRSIIQSRGAKLGSDVFLVSHNQVLCISVDECQANVASVDSLTLQGNISVQADSTHLTVLRSLEGDGSTILSKVFTSATILQRNLSTLLQDASNVDDTAYFLLDLNGYIVAGGQSGNHISDVFPRLLQDLVVRGIFSKGLITGYELQSCEMYSKVDFPGCIDNAGLSMYKGILTSLYQLIVSFITGGMWMAGKFALFSIMAVVHQFFSLVSVSSQEADSTLTEMFSRNYSEGCPVRLCLSQFTAYELHASFSSVMSVTVMCANHSTETIEYSAVRIGGTDLLLLSVNNNCSMLPTSNVENKFTDIPCPCDNHESIPQSSFSLQCSIDATSADECSSSSKTSTLTQYGYFFVAFITFFVTLQK